MIQHSSNGFYDDMLTGGIIDLTHLNPNEDDEEEICYCKVCDRRMLYCKHDNNDLSNGPLHKKGQYMCPRCGRVEDGLSSEQSKRKEKKRKKAPDLYVSQSHSLGFLGCLAIPLQTRADEAADDDDIDTLGDEYLESLGADIKETQIYFPESARTIVRKK